MILVGQATIRAVCSILDAFHFPLEDNTSLAKEGNQSANNAAPNQATPSAPSGAAMPDEATVDEPAGMPNEATPCEPPGTGFIGQADGSGASSKANLPNQATAPSAQDAVPDQATGSGAPEPEASDEAMGDDGEAGNLEEETPPETGQTAAENAKAVQDTLVRLVLPALRSQLVKPPPQLLSHTM